MGRKRHNYVNYSELHKHSALQKSHSTEMDIIRGPWAIIHMEISKKEPSNHLSKPPIKEPTDSQGRPKFWN